MTKWGVENFNSHFVFSIELTFYRLSSKIVLLFKCLKVEPQPFCLCQQLLVDFSKKTIFPERDVKIIRVVVTRQVPADNSINLLLVTLFYSGPGANHLFLQFFDRHSFYFKIILYYRNCDDPY